MNVSRPPAPAVVLIVGSDRPAWGPVAQAVAARLARGGAGRGGVVPGEAAAVIALSRRECRPEAPFAGPLFAAIAGAAETARARPAAVGLVVPLISLSESPESPADGGPADMAGSTETGPQTATRLDDVAAAGLRGPAVIEDHVDLALRSPLRGVWPMGMERTFPSMSGVYAPGLAERLTAAADDAAPPAVARAAVRPEPGRAAGAPPPSSTARTAKRRPAAGSVGSGAAIYSRIAVAGVADARRLSVWEQQQARAAGLTAAADSLVAPVVIAAYYGLAVAAVGVIVGTGRLIETDCRGGPPEGDDRVRTGSSSTNEGEL